MKLIKIINAKNPARSGKYAHKAVLECELCLKSFIIPKWQYDRIINNQLEKNERNGRFCSTKCRNQNDSNIGKQNNIKINCRTCGKEFEIKKYRAGRKKFCSRTCCGSYACSCRKPESYRRSNLEKYIEKKLKNIYPQLDFQFNNKKYINSELDIFIPNLKLAFELNGAFHYEPIFGEEKLNKIQNNDNRKFQACIEKQISLCVIDTSIQRVFSEETSQPFLDIITKIINDKLKES